MHPYRVIVRMYIRSDGLSTRPDYQNTLNRQFTDTNDAPMDPLHVPFTWNPSRFTDTLRLRLCLLLHLQTWASPLMLQSP